VPQNGVFKREKTEITARKRQNAARKFALPACENALTAPKNQNVALKKRNAPSKFPARAEQKINL